MGTITRMVNKVRNWLTTPGKTFGTGWAPTSRHIPEPDFENKHSHSYALTNVQRCASNKKAKRRAARKVAEASRRRNRV